MLCNLPNFLTTGHLLSLTIPCYRWQIHWPRVTFLDYSVISTVVNSGFPNLVRLQLQKYRKTIPCWPAVYLVRFRNRYLTDETGVLIFNENRQVGQTWPEKNKGKRGKQRKITNNRTECLEESENIEQQHIETFRSVIEKLRSADTVLLLAVSYTR